MGKSNQKRVINFIPNAQKITNQCAAHKSLVQREHVLNSICIIEKKVNYLCKTHIPMQNSVVKLCLLYGANCVFAPAACGLLLNMQRFSLTVQYLLQPHASEFPGKKGSRTHMLASQNYKAM